MEEEGLVDGEAQRLGDAESHVILCILLHGRIEPHSLGYQATRLKVLCMTRRIEPRR